MKTIFVSVLVLLVSFVSAKEKEAEKAKSPRGYMDITELPQAIEKSAGKKLLMVVVKGSDDACPNCAAALENGEKAVGSSAIKLFTRDFTIRKLPKEQFSEELQKRIDDGFVGGAWVTIVILSPDGKKILAESDRKDLQSNKKAIKAFKDKVKLLKEEYK